jgi:hypothetical protein
MHRGRLSQTMRRLIKSNRRAYLRALDFFDNISLLSLCNSISLDEGSPGSTAILRNDPSVVLTSTKPPRKSSGRTSGQTVQDEIAELGLRLSQLRFRAPIELTRKPTPS